jgi:hypothetical protein
MLFSKPADIVALPLALRLRREIRDIPRPTGILAAISLLPNVPAAAAVASRGNAASPEQGSMVPCVLRQQPTASSTGPSIGPHRTPTSTRSARLQAISGSPSRPARLRLGTPTPSPPATPFEPVEPCWQGEGADLGAISEASATDLRPVVQRRLAPGSPDPFLASSTEGGDRAWSTSPCTPVTDEWDVLDASQVVWLQGPPPSCCDKRRSR